MNANFNSFVTAVTDSIQQYLPPAYADAEIRVSEIQKLNNSYTGLMARKPDSKVSASVNLNLAYDLCQQDGFEAAMRWIAEMAQMMPQGFDTDILRDYEQAKRLLTIRVSNFESNAAMLADVPHTRVEDLAITYHLMMEQGDGETYSAIVSNTLLEEYGISLEQLHQDACLNSSNISPACIKPMMQMMLEITGAGSDESFEEMLNDLDGSMDGFYVLTNKSRMQGASVVFYPDLLAGLQAKMHKGFYILPSSVHEMLVVPETDRLQLDGLKQMVYDINRTVLAPEDLLSDTVYHYGCDHIFETANNYIMRQAVIQKAGF